ncbi:hypothetical protein ACFXPQ_00265 [Streptomyces lydicus]
MAEWAAVSVAELTALAPGLSAGGDVRACTCPSHDFIDLFWRIL